MEIKTGDKVRYLDAVGGGTVTGFRGKDLVLVLEEDGFETPVLKRQCVVVEQAGRPAETPAAKPSGNPSVEVPTPSSSGKPTSTPSVVVTKTPTSQPDTRAGEQINLSLAYLPAEGKTVMEGPFEAYLINDSNFTLLFNYASCSGKSWTSRFAGSIEPHAKLFLEEFGKECINDLEKVSLQLVAFKPSTFYAFKNTFSVEIRLDTVKFYKVHCFRENDYFDEDALLVPVVRNDLPEKTLLIEAEDIRKAMLDKQPEKPTVSQPLKPKAGPLEVDLHIGSLLDSTVGMDNAAILQYQLDVFRKTMDEHLQRKGFRIVFIHGKGDGVLRTAILKELRSSYKTCRYQDASFKEYGFGATMVSIG